MCEDPVSDEQDKSHVREYVSPEGPRDGTSPNELDKSHVPNYVSPKGPRDEHSPDELDKGHIRELYVTPLPDPEDEPQPDPQQVERERILREVAEHAALVRRLQDEDRKRAAKSAEPNKEGRD